MLAQVAESFSDGDFVNAPAWSGNQSHFIVENGELRLNAAPVAGSAFLSTPSSTLQNASWEFIVRMGFNPSSTNRTQIYILSDSEDLSGSLNGYFVMVGDTPDEISLYRQSGSSKIKLIDGANGRVNLAIVNTRIKVTRDDAGNWELFSDTGLTGTFVSEGTAFDNSWTDASWFGILCTYTATRSDDFYFDDIVVTGSPLTDITPPEIEQLNVTSSQSIELIFSEPLDESTAESVTNYVLSPGQNPGTATLNERAVILSFEDHFSNASNHIVSISQVEDLSGNSMAPVQKTFFYFQPVVASGKDVILTEIFADPEPSQELPAVEFVELLNRSDKVFDLSGWVISDGSSAGMFPQVYLFPGDYLVVTSSGDVNAFSGTEKVVGLPNFPSLNNSGDVLILKDASSRLVDAVRYTDSWYNDDDKQSGGWTLELIDPNNTCSEAENWTAAEDGKGGTPGKVNSVLAHKPDLGGPILLSVIPTSPTTLVIRFSEKLENTSLSKEQFIISPKIEISTLSFTDSLLTSAVMTLAAALDETTLYTLTANGIYDCAGNPIQEKFNKTQFGVPGFPSGKDILINEVLFNPTHTGVDFVELYNASSKFINATTLTMLNANGDATSVSRDDRLIAPHQYIVLTSSKSATISEYSDSAESTFYETRDMPSMNDDEGILRILAGDVLIDSFSYHRSMHSPFLKNDEGVSLERISFSGETNLAANWKSASSTSGYATPGYLNSNARADMISGGQVSVEPEVFSPFDSQQNFVLVRYAFDTGGQVANADILDSHGRVIFTLANNELLGTSGFFRWDGNGSDGYKARVGYYMVRFEVFDATGVVRVFRKRLAIASRF